MENGMVLTIQYTYWTWMCDWEGIREQRTVIRIGLQNHLGLNLPWVGYLSRLELLWCHDVVHWQDDMTSESKSAVLGFLVEDIFPTQLPWPWGCENIQTTVPDPFGHSYLKYCSRLHSITSSPEFTCWTSNPSEYDLNWIKSHFVNAIRCFY